MLSLYEDFFSTSRRNAKNKLNISSRSGTIFHSQTRPGTHTIHKERFTVPTDAHTNSPTLHTRAGAHTKSILLHPLQQRSHKKGSLHQDQRPFGLVSQQKTKAVHCAQSGCFSATRENGSLHLNPPPNPHTDPLTLHTRAGAHTKSILLHPLQQRSHKKGSLHQDQRPFGLVSQQKTKAVHCAQSGCFSATNRNGSLDRHVDFLAPRWGDQTMLNVFRDQDQSGGRRETMRSTPPLIST